MPRITNPMMTNIVLGDMHNNLSRMLKMQHQIATNKKYDRPSDNPVDVVRDMALGTNIYENFQFIRNMDDGMTWLKNSEGAFNYVTSVAQRIRELAIYAGNGALEGVDMDAIATEMAELQEELRNSANFSVAGRYLLGGLDVTEPPFVRDANGQVAYEGNEYHAEFEMERGVTGQVSFHGREVFPVNERQYSIQGTEVPLDFTWQGRAEILQFQVGDRVAKVHLSELWSDDNTNGQNNATDFNQFRDPREMEGKTLEDVAELVRKSLGMGDVGRLVSVDVKSDPTRGVQWLEIRGHTGEPVRVTSWPETDFPKQPDAVFGDTVPAAWTSGAGGELTVRWDDGRIDTVAVAAGQTMAQVRDQISQKIDGLTALVKQTAGSPQALLLYGENRERSFRVEATGGLEALFATYDYSKPLVGGGYERKALERKSIALPSFAGVVRDVPGGPAPGAAADTLTFSWEGKTETLSMGGINTAQDLAGAIMALYNPDPASGGDPSDAGHALVAEVRQVGGAEQLFVYSANGGKAFSVSASGATAQQYMGAVPLDAGAVFSLPNTDHSHMDFSSLMRLETSVKSVEVPVSNPVVRSAGDGELHFHLESGARRTELIIPAGTDVTIDELADRIRGVAGTWLDVVVESDQDEGGRNDMLGRTSGNAEPATKRLILRTKDGQGVALFDHNPVPAVGGAPAPETRFAATLGLSTAPYGVGGGAFPSGDTLDPYMPALMEVSVGDKMYRVKLYATGDDSILTAGGVVDASKLVAQIQQQVGEDVLGYHVEDPSDPASAFALYAKTGEPLRIVDLPFADPNAEDFSGGLARSTGMATGVLGGGVLDTTTAGVAGLIRIQTGAKTLDISVRATDTLRDLAQRIRKEAGEWVDVAYVDPDLSTAGSTVQISLASKDGSPLSIYDISGSGAVTFGFDTALRSTASAAGWTAAAGDRLTLNVNGYEHTIDLWDAAAGTPLVNGLDGLVSAINSRFQGKDVVAAVVDAGGGDQRLVLSSPRGYRVDVDEAKTQLTTPLNLPAAASPSRGGLGAQNQMTTVRTAADQKATDFFGVMEDLVSAVREEDRQGISNSLLKRIDTFMDNLMKRRTQAGAMLLRYENSQRRLTENNTNLTELRSQVSEPDLAEALTKFNMAQAVYQASLSTIARVVQPTLVDFLK